ncbi:D-alanyl-D-alanine carboxypeptidase [Chelativorans sp. YIM 93263]|uniref:D-alanyl-D-alanine carboxypeptidase n=1 Tax=Chelativorans sp. YIM 93263 TaxID=2906648 RepID=UPI0023781A4B|nr:D-alanyl-D-alanine carboxypeptidase family protein [Chelativorans sp. YIM 93263]
MAEFTRLARQFPKSFIAAFALVAFALAASPAAANEKYAGFVIDARNGNVLYEDRADAPRYPASLTKMMTLYMIFEALEQGRVSKNTRITFSRNASAEPPTKIGVPAGKSITLEQAIYALVTKSANDVATAVAENLGGSEANFARSMTEKARQLGMSSTTFKNAHGLPNSAQKTTARDMARLGIALREHFPQYYDYFSTRSFTYAGQRFGNHNNLLGRVKGVDGIKTGYIRASGFNLVSSVSTDGRSIVAVVMGGRTTRTRDAHMQDLIQRTLPKASTGEKRNLIARGQPTLTKIASVNLPQTVPLPAERPEEVAMTAYTEEPTAAAKAALAEIIAEGSREEPDPISTSSAEIKGWVIQVASTPTEDGALKMLQNTTEQAPTVLAKANPFTEVFTKDGQTFYRARFGGFNGKSEAWAACASLKKKSVACYAIEK